LAKHKSSSLLILTFRKEKEETKDIREFLSKKIAQSSIVLHKKEKQRRKNLGTEKNELSNAEDS
jgi:thiamine phosphate synthase YjbQ (UPF0047 family)